MPVGGPDQPVVHVDGEPDPVPFPSEAGDIDPADPPALWLPSETLTTSTPTGLIVGPGSACYCCGPSPPPPSPCRTPYCTDPTNRCATLDLTALKAAMTAAAPGVVWPCGGLPDSVLLNFQVCLSNGSVVWEVHDGAGNRSVTLCSHFTDPNLPGGDYECPHYPAYPTYSIPFGPCIPTTFPAFDAIGQMVANAGCFEYGPPPQGAVSAEVRFSGKRVVASGYQQVWAYRYGSFGIGERRAIRESGGWTVLQETVELTTVATAYATPGSPVTINIQWTLTVQRYSGSYGAAVYDAPQYASYYQENLYTGGSVEAFEAAHPPTFTPDFVTDLPFQTKLKVKQHGPVWALLDSFGQPLPPVNQTFSGTTTITLTAGQPCTGGGFMAPAPLAGPPPDIAWEDL